MTKVIVDDTLRSKLHNLTEGVELCDATKALPFLTPAYDPSGLPAELQVSKRNLTAAS